MKEVNKLLSDPEIDKLLNNTRRIRMRASLPYGSGIDKGYFIFNITASTVEEAVKETISIIDRPENYLLWRLDRSTIKDSIEIIAHD
jgi:hypothetical protein